MIEGRFVVFFFSSLSDSLVEKTVVDNISEVHSLLATSRESLTMESPNSQSDWNMSNILHGPPLHGTSWSAVLDYLPLN